MNKVFSEEDLSKFWQIVQKSNKIVLFGHKNPDGDALGSTLAMAGVIEKLQVKTNVIVPDPFPVFYSWMPNAEKVLDYSREEAKCNSLINEADLILFMDFNQYGRIGNISKNIELKKEKIVLIDHHPDPTENVQMLFSYPPASSTCEIVYRMIEEAHKQTLLNADIATCLLTGMVTDTGGFSYNSDTPEFFGIVAALIEAGAVKDEIFKQVFNNNNASRFRLLGTVLQNNLAFNYDRGVAIMWLSAEDLKKNDFQKGDTEGFVNMPLSIKGIHKSVLVTEHDDEVKLSFRSQGDYAVNGFAEKYFNGGGHRNAAGGHSKEAFQVALKRLMENLDKL